MDLTGHMLFTFVSAQCPSMPSDLTIILSIPPAVVRGLIALRILCLCHMSVQRSNYHSNVLSKASESFLPFAKDSHVKACFRLDLYGLTYATICAASASAYASYAPSTFCPRVLGDLLRNPMLKRASDWTYTGSHTRLSALPTSSQVLTYMSWSNATIFFKCSRQL